MRARIVTTIARKELLEALRDRRTLVLMVLLPVLLYPGLLLLVSQFAAAHFADVEATVSEVRVIGATASHPLVERLRAVAEVRVDVAAEGSAGADVSVDGSADVDVVVDLSGWPAALPEHESAHVQVSYQAVSDAARQALDRVHEVARAWSDDEQARRLEARGLPEAFAAPLDWREHNTSPPAEAGGHVLAALLPMLVLVTVLMGAYYPAIDLTAGEKERGTIQTLFTAPVAPLEVVTGKYLAVLGVSTLSGTANLGSMALVVGQNVLLSDELAAELDLSLSLSAALGLGFAMVMVALLFSALMMAVAVLARSFKEAQTFVTPVYLLCLVPAMVAQLPGVEWTPALGVLPAVGPLLLMKSVLTDGVELSRLFTVAGATVVYTGLALLLASRLFGQEQVLIGERGSLRILPRRAELAPAPRPTPEVAVAWYGVMFVALFYVGGALQARAPQPGVVATLWLVLLAPTVAFAAWLKLDLKDTFSLRAPRWEAWPIVVVFAIGSVVVINAANAFLDAHILPTPDGVKDQLAQFLSRPESLVEWGWFLFVIAVSPAICEELLFRGFFASSLRGRVRPAAVALATGLAFGVFHLSVYRLFGTAALGVLMAVVVSRTRSVYPAMLFHFLNNSAAAIAYARLDEDAVLPGWLVAAGALAFGAGLWGLARRFPYDAEVELPRGRASIPEHAV